MIRWLLFCIPPQLFTSPSSHWPCWHLMKGNEKSIQAHLVERTNLKEEMKVLPCHMCVFVLYQSFHRDSWCLTFSHYTRSCCSCVQLCNRTQMLWHLSIPGDAKLPSHSVELLFVCWVLEEEVLPSLLTRILNVSSVLPSAFVTLLPLGMPVNILHKAWASCT